MSGEPRGTPDPNRSVSLPAERAFVLQLRTDSGGGPDGVWTGRVEHVVSGRAARFDDCAGLRRFIEQTLRELADPGRPR